MYYGGLRILKMEKRFKQELQKLFLDPVMLLILLFFFVAFVYLNVGSVIEAEPSMSRDFVGEVMGIGGSALIGYFLITVGLAMLPTVIFTKVGVVLIAIGAVLSGGSLIGLYLFISKNLYLILGLLFAVFAYKAIRERNFRKSMSAAANRPMPRSTHHHHYYVSNSPGSQVKKNKRLKK